MNNRGVVYLRPGYRIQTESPTGLKNNQTCFSRAKPLINDPVSLSKPLSKPESQPEIHTYTALLGLTLYKAERLIVNKKIWAGDEIVDELLVTDIDDKWQTMPVIIGAENGRWCIRVKLDRGLISSVEPAKK